MTESLIESMGKAIGFDPMEFLGKECVGCDKTQGLEMCEGTMCRKCWEAENQEPN